jgi:hypothetical protein
VEEVPAGDVVGEAVGVGVGPVGERGEQVRAVEDVVGLVVARTYPRATAATRSAG